MNPNQSVDLVLQVEEETYTLLTAKLPVLLQKGFMVTMRPGLSVGKFLRQHLPPEYIARRISTVFLDGKPVDDIDGAILRDGSTLALSGAMPGLVGAVMRRGGYYSSFRDSITYCKQEETHRTDPEEGMIRLKLFNLVMKDLGPVFLEIGVYLETELFIGFLEQQRKLIGFCRQALLDRTPVEPARLYEHPMLKSREWVRLGIEKI
jgi:hypothetical protein